MKKIVRPLLLSVGFYAAACGIVLRVIPGGMTRAETAPLQNTSVTSSAAAPSGSAALPADPAKAVAAPRGSSFEVVDISHHDTIADWTSLKTAAAGLYMKATEGATYVDPMLGAYTAAAAKAGLPIGFFHYFWPSGDPQDAARQADHFYQTIKAYSYTFFPAIDVEENNNLSPAALTASVQAFNEEFEKLSGHSLLIYCSRKFADKYLSDPALSKYGLWVADYNGQEPTQAGAWKTHVMWQYTSTASVPGVPTPMDADHATPAIILPGH